MSKKVVIIGGGPGGYTAAIRLAQLGADVTLIEKDSVGGTCLNRGCIPTKALVKSAEVMNTVRSSSEFGIEIEGGKINHTQVMERKNQIVKKLTDGIFTLVKKNNINFITGIANFVDSHTVQVKAMGDDQDETLTRITGDYFIIASGSEPSIPPIQGSNLSGIHTSDTILNIKFIPKRLTIIGGGVIGMEFSSIFNAFGTEVTVIEAMPSILGKVDSDISKRCLPSFKKQGIIIHTNTMVQEIQHDGENFITKAESKKGTIEVTSDALLISTGRKPYTKNLNIEEINIKTSHNWIETNENHQTNLPHIYAIGDVTGGWMLAHAASHMGLHVAEHIMNFEKEPPSQNVIPSCIFTFPEIACVGITEDEAKAQNLSCKTSKFMFGANGKALCLGEGEGFVKVIADENTHKILGVHIMGPHASDLIHQGVIAIQKELSTQDFADVVYAHPTLSESLWEALMNVDGTAIHMINR